MEPSHVPTLYISSKVADNSASVASHIALMPKAGGSAEPVSPATIGRLLRIRPLHAADEIMIYPISRSPLTNAFHHPASAPRQKYREHQGRQAGPGARRDDEEYPSVL
jgi:hypothetical protein